MKLVHLEAVNFRSLKEFTVTFEPFTVMIGENDAGKSSVLDLVEICLTGTSPDASDYYDDEDGNPSAKIEAVLTFQMDGNDVDSAIFASEDGLKVKFCFALDAKECFYWGSQLADKRLRVDFSKLKAEEQKTLIRTLDETVNAQDLGNFAKRSEWFSAYCQDAPTQEVWIDVPTKWTDRLPRFERYSAMDYSAPENLITKTLKRVYEHTIYDEVKEPDGSTRKMLIQPLQDLQEEARQKMCQEVEKLEEFVKKYDLRIADLGYEPRFDFSNSLRAGDLKVSTGRGLRFLSKTGAGTRRRMFMGILDWDHQVAMSEALSGESLPPVIRGYDEPGTNLHYDAQKRMYYSIESIVNAENSRTQAIICTHSMTMVDRAPAQNIRLFRLDKDGHTEVSRLETDDDPEIETFLNDVAREMGITNSLIFYERCFILVEGETEENALPILYRRLHGRSLLEDGVRIINVRGNGAVKEFLRLMSRNRQEQSIIFVDKDIESQEAARLTTKALEAAGFDDAFIAERFLLAGEQEFEDIFPDEVQASCLEKNWPKTSDPWTHEDIAQHRLNGGKFSKLLKDMVWNQCHVSGEKWTKPAYGQRLAEICPTEKIPTSIIALFKLAREVAGVQPTTVGT